MTSGRTLIRFLPALLLAVTLSTGSAVAGDAIYTTDKTGTVVNQDIYALSTDVYLSGGPQNDNSSGLPDGTYYFQVTDPRGNTLLSSKVVDELQLLLVHPARHCDQQKPGTGPRISS